MEAVRAINRQGRGASVTEVLSALAGQGLDTAAPDQPGQMEAAPDQAGRAEAAPAQTSRVKAALAAHPGIRSFTGLDGGQVYHDPALVSATYARILDRKASPIRLMTEEIRLNSREYPRPVPLELFEAPPFSLTPEDIAGLLPAMAGNPEFADIACAVTADGALYLYSTQSLEPAYAEFLAEHARNLARNP